MQKVVRIRLAHMALVLPAGGPLDDKHLLPEVSTLFMAGFESESALLSVAMYMHSPSRSAQQLFSPLSVTLSMTQWGLAIHTSCCSAAGMGLSALQD